MTQEEEIHQILERNQRVETDKAWETSLTRRFIVSLLTYLTILIFLYMIGAPYPYLNALIPTLGFYLSTLTLPFFKKLWIRYARAKDAH